MAKFTDLPAEIVRQILTYERTFLRRDDLLLLAFVCHQWYAIIVDAFMDHYDFLDKWFLKQTWAYVILPERIFERINQGPYFIYHPLSRSSIEYYTVWANEFKNLRSQLRKERGRLGGFEEDEVRTFSANKPANNPAHKPIHMPVHKPDNELAKFGFWSWLFEPLKFLKERGRVT